MSASHHEIHPVVREGSDTLRDTAILRRGEIGRFILLLLF
jgi:hypothetical protein